MTASVNLYNVGEHFIEAIIVTEQDSIEEGRGIEQTEEMDRSWQEIKFKVAIRGWSHRTEQCRANAILPLQNDLMAKRMQENQDLIVPKKTVLCMRQN